MKADAERHLGMEQLWKRGCLWWLTLGLTFKEQRSQGDQRGGQGHRSTGEGGPERGARLDPVPSDAPPPVTLLLEVTPVTNEPPHQGSGRAPNMSHTHTHTQ